MDEADPSARAAAAACSCANSNCARWKPVELPLLVAAVTAAAPFRKHFCAAAPSGVQAICFLCALLGEPLLPVEGVSYVKPQHRHKIEIKR
ncbi:unnamed protein product [Gongylonema pulchrum]|uniref:Secreted protein n=1 Tax=Gongylonema pulchrum TaxID=637853 RepID=A0A183DBT5_9BILA|nr:unnamed protein product [Gongylonema pulchrum]